MSNWAYALFCIIPLVLLMLARIADEMDWIRRGRPERKFTKDDYFTDGEYD